MVDWVAEVEVNQTGSAVRLHLRSPDDPVRVRKPAKVYPPPQIATEAVKEAIQRRLANFLTELKTDTPDAAIWACKWDTLKVDIRKETLTIIKTRRKTARATYKQKIRRLLKQELRLRDAVEGHSPSIDSVTDALDVLTLNEGHGGSPLQRVRHAIAECTRMRAVVHQRRLFREGGHGEGKTTKAMFRRVSTKYADNEIHCLDAAIDHQARGVHEKADTLADAWSPIFQQPGSSKKARAEVLSWLGTKRQYETDLADLIESFTEAEVAAAIGASKPGKACGSDRLGNDWYRDFAEQLIPILTIMMNCWYSAGVFPPSFLEADIFCLKKGGAMQNPLNYRPLALLDTDYKILTRMLATRTSRKLHAIIHRNQNGFVPFRTIHETIDLYAAAQAAAQSDPAMKTALALLLDFCKAYDSVDREFLYDVLEWLGCPKDYGQAMRKLHDGTKVRFLANGFRSRWVRVTCGIRQGCPLAPLLFLFVLEALYRRIDAETSVKGIMLRSGAGSVQLKVGGYADDTASYVRSTAEIPPIMSITQVFATASGLRLNAEKTLVIALNPNAISTMDQLPAPLVVQPAAKLSRYLGIPVGSIPDDDYTWTLTTTQLVTRLALAARKTMTADQRSMVVAAVVIPKLTFIARHIWPTSDWIARFQKMINNFVWHARFTDGHVAGRAWLNGHVAALPRKHGGLNIPALKLEVLSLAAVTVSKWALEAELDTLIVGDVLAGNRSSPQAPPLYVSPRHTIPSTNGKRMCATLWATGVLVSSTFGGETTLPEKSSMVRTLHCSTYFRGPLGLFWRGRRLDVDTSPLSGPLSRSYMAAEADVHGTFCTEWLPFVVLSELRLYSERGVVVNPNTRFRAICHRGRLLKDVLHWTWKRNGGMLVTALCKHFNSAVRGQVVYLFQLLLLNYPQLLVPGDHSGDIRYTTLPEGHVPIKRQISNEKHLLGGQGRPLARIPKFGTVPQRSRCCHATRGWTGSDNHVGSPPPPVVQTSMSLGGSPPLEDSTQSVQRHTGHGESGERHCHWYTKTGPMEEIERTSGSGTRYTCLDTNPGVVGLNPWGEQMLLRVKHHAMSTYNPVSSGFDCPHPACVHQGRVDLYHVFWECPAAEKLRSILVSRWEAVGLPIGSAEEAIFSLALPGLPQLLMKMAGRVLSQLPDTHTDLVGDTVDRMVRNCWSIGVALYLLAVWRWRVGFFDPHNDVTEQYHVAGLKSRIRQGYLDITTDVMTTLPIDITKRLSAAICGGLGADNSGLPVPTRATGYCFLIAVAGIQGKVTDKSYSGTLIVKVHRLLGTYEVQYSASTTYSGGGLTSYRAVYLGMLKGLRRCIQHHWGEVHVMGDHADALRMQARRAPPGATSLKGPFWKVRRAADAVAVACWNTTLREHNQTTRRLANMAKDTQQDMEWDASVLPDAGHRWAGVLHAAASDVEHWLHERSTQAPHGAGVDKV